MTPKRRGLVAGWVCGVVGASAAVTWATHGNAEIAVLLTLDTVVLCAVAWMAARRPR